MVNREALMVNREALMANREALMVNREALMVNREALMVNREALMVNREVKIPICKPLLAICKPVLTIYNPGLSLDRAYHDALNEITLQEWINTEYRHRGNNDGRVFNGFRELVYLVVFGRRRIEDVRIGDILSLGF